MFLLNLYGLILYETNFFYCTSMEFSINRCFHCTRSRPAMNLIMTNVKRCSYGVFKVPCAFKISTSFLILLCKPEIYEKPFLTLERFSVSVVKPRTKQFLWPTTTDVKNTPNQSEHEANTGNPRQARENGARKSRLVLVLLLTS